MRKHRFTKESLADFIEILKNPEHLIGVAFFLKEEGEVLVVGDIAGTGVGATADTLWGAIDTYGIIAKMSDSDIAKEFGNEVVCLDDSDEALVAKNLAIESLKEKVKDLPGIVEIRSTPTSICVRVTEAGQYDGPWEWEGFSVHAEVAV